MTVKTTILIPVASHSRTIAGTLESLSECVLPSSLSSVLIVENGDEPLLEETVLAFANRLPVVHAFTPTKGKSHALNYGIDNFIGDEDFVIFSDDDIRFGRDWIVNYEKAFLEHGRRNYFGGAFEVDYETRPPEALRALLPGSARGISEDEFLANESMCFRGFNWAAAKSDLEKVGLFGEDISHGTKFGATGEETLVIRKMRKAGMRRVVVRGNTVLHSVPADKCSYPWLKRRAKTSGAEQFFIATDRNAWLRAKTGGILLGILHVCTGRFDARYRLVCDVIKMRGFVEALWNERSKRNS